MAPLAWIRKIAEQKEFNQTPLFGNVPHFDWDALSSSLSLCFDLSHLKIRPKSQMWKEGSDIKKDLGADLLILPITIAPLGTVFWMMSKADIGKLSSWMMKTPNKTKTISSEFLQEGFYRYLILEALNTLQEIPPIKEFTLSLSEEEEILSRAFCVDIEIDFGTKESWGRLMIPHAMQTAWIQHFARMPSGYVSTELAKATELVIGVKTGSVSFSQEEWADLQIGDFVLLDHGNHKSDLALMMLDTTPIFNVKIKHDKLELTDYALHYEDNMERKEGVVALKELKVQVTVEVARLKITLDELMHLTPGHTLELPVHPDQGVDLTINGQKVGRAELVHLGEQLGIRILELS